MFGLGIVLVVFGTLSLVQQRTPQLLEAMEGKLTAPTIEPSELLPIPTGEKGGNQGELAQQTESAIPSTYSPRDLPCNEDGAEIAILTMRADPNRRQQHDDRLWNASFRNKQLYAALHGYQLHVMGEIENAKEEVDKGLAAETSTPPASPPARWKRKLRFLLDELPKRRWVLWVDPDVLFTNPMLSLEHLTFPSADLVLSRDWNGWSTAVWLLQNNSFTLDLLGELLKMDDVGASGGDGDKLAFEVLYAEHLPPERDCPTQAIALAKELKYRPRRGTVPSSWISQAESAWAETHLYVAPQKSFNAYPAMMVPRKNPGSLWSEGDFIFHAPWCQERSIVCVDEFLALAKAVNEKVKAHLQVENGLSGTNSIPMGVLINASTPSPSGSTRVRPRPTPLPVTRRPPESPDPPATPIPPIENAIRITGTRRRRSQQN